VGNASSVDQYRIVSVNVAEPSVLLKWATGDIISAIDKRPVARTSVLELRTLNLEGDRQADTRPTPAALGVLSTHLRYQLLREGRDVTGGVPEDD
jgi:hypothetical protein